MSWLRATLIALVIVAVAFGLLAYVPNLLVSSVGGLGRSARVALATAAFTVGVAALLWALRHLQARGRFE